MEFFKKHSQESKDRRNQKRRQRRKDNAQQLLERKNNNRELYLLRSAKARANKNGLAFDITINDIHIPNFCPNLDIPLECSVGKVSQNSPSIDRKIPSLGYIKGNIQVISHLANSMKNCATPYLLLKFAEWVIRDQGMEELVK